MLIFGQVFLAFVSQYWLQRWFGTWVPDAATGRENLVLPGWLEKRKARLYSKYPGYIYNGMIRMRGVYIKLGQVLSILGGFLPREFTKQFEKLQDQVPEQPIHVIRSAWEASTGKKFSDAYNTFSEKPLAAASLGQVHRATLHDGREVAVKVLYPGIRKVIDVDMAVLHLCMRVYRMFVPVKHLDRVHHNLHDLLKRETNYLYEAKCMQRVAENFKDQPDILVPETVWEWTTQDVLTMTFMEGIKISKTEEMKSNGIDPKSVAIRLTESFYKQIFVDHLFHADPHPGNFLVQAGKTPRRPKLVILDYGAVSEVKKELIEGLFLILKGIQEEDRKAVLEGIYAMGFVSETGDKALLESTIRTYFTKLMGVKDRSAGTLMRANQKEIEALADPEVARAEMRKLMESVEYPEGWFYVERASAMLFWLVGQIDPSVDTMKVGFPYAMDLLNQNQGRQNDV